MSCRSAFKFCKNLKEIRLHLCQKSATSQGTRDFIEQYYVPIKKNNPTFPILIRECGGIEPVLWARYEFGKEEKNVLTNKSKDEVFDILQLVAS